MAWIDFKKAYYMALQTWIIIQRGFFLKKFAFAIAICNNNDATQLHTEEVRSGLQIYKITRKD